MPLMPFDINSNIKRLFTPMLLLWFKNNARNLPWRKTKEPYKIWLSEVILQQTQIIQGTSYYLKFIKEYPNIELLCNDEIDNILRLWQGLGYYARARNLHQCAQQIVSQYNGQFPNQYKELLQLKGVGKYTAAAIASICFDKPVGVVDGNVYRFISRCFGIDKDISKSSTYDFFKHVLEDLMPSNTPGAFNQAIMEMGATICKPKIPLCEHCFCKDYCFAKKNDLISVLPYKSKKIKIKKRHLYYCFYIYDNKIWIKKRTSGIWNGLYEGLLLDAKTSPMNTEKVTSYFSNNVNSSINDIVWKARETFSHQLTHQSLSIDIISAYIKTNPCHLEKQGFIGVALKKLEKYPFPIIIAKYLKNLNSITL